MNLAQPAKLARHCASAFLLLTACTCNWAHDRKPFRLECHGDRIIDSQPIEHLADAIYYIDPNLPALQVWNPVTGRYAAWNGDLHVTRKGVIFRGSRVAIPQGATVNRTFNYVRSSSAVTDIVDASWGAGMAFKGKCVRR